MNAPRKLLGSLLAVGAWALGPALLSGCPEGPKLAEIQDAPPMIGATVVSRTALDALLPTDILAAPDGGVWVLDSYSGRAVQLDRDGKVRATIGDAERWGHPLRMVQGDEAHLWLSDPTGRVFQVDLSGAISAELPAPPLSPEAGGEAPEGGERAGSSSPVALLSLDGTLVVSDRSGRVSWLDAATGQVRRTLSQDAEGEAFSLIADLAAGAGGHIFGVDTLSGRVQVLSGEGEALSTFGHYGTWAGYLKQPKAVLALGEGALAVADSEQGAVQFFDEDGAARGVLAVDGTPLSMAHPVAMARGEDGELLVLDAGGAELIRLKLDDRALDEAMTGPPRRWLRAPLAPAEELLPKGGQRCLQCHSGLINDSREVWDVKKDAHPVNVKPEKAIPAYFPLSEDGQVVCSTCHSPHGAVSLSELEGATTEARVGALSRHAGEGSTFLRMGRESSELCVACHTSSAHEGALEMLSLGGGGHPTGDALVAALAKRGGSEKGASTVEDPTRGQCLSCHAVHGATGPSLTRSDADGKLCVACHEQQADATHTHPMGLTEGSVSVHPERSGLPLDSDGHVTCRSCHELVGGRGEALLRPPASGATLCASCHSEQAAELGGDHAHVRGAEGINCLACHDPHGQSMGEALLRGSGQASKADPDGCLACHGPRGSAAKAGLSPGVLGHPVDGAVHEGSADPLSCQTCHAAHDARVQDKGVKACESCHAEQASAAHRGGHGEAGCLDCHPMHQAAPKAKLSADTNPRAATCLACHATTSAEAKAPKVASFNHPAMVFTPDGQRWTPLGDLPLFAADGTQQPKGTNGALVCSSCHLTHGPDKSEPGDKLRRPGWKEACAACHGENALPLYRYFHQPDRWEDLGVKP